MSEHDLIKQYFAPLSRDGLRDDAAVIAIPTDQELVISSDTLSEGTHFWPGEAPENIARKALRVNLSDLAAMGADPLCYQLCIAFPEKPGLAWVQKFTDALVQEQKKYQIYCSGGDTTTLNGALTISITVLGLVPAGQAIRRQNARTGDRIVLTGPVGDAWVGLQVLRGSIKPDDPSVFLDAYRVPRPAVELAALLRRDAHACIDVSDGLLADIGHIARESNLLARLTFCHGMVSPAAHVLLEKGAVSLLDLLTGGDDYVLACAVPEHKVQSFCQGIQKYGHNPVVVGVLESGPSGVVLQDENGRDMPFKQTGWSHF